MSRNPGLNQTLELLNSLKGMVNDFAAREEKLNSEFQSRTIRERQRRDEAIEEKVNRLAGRTTELDAGQAAAEKRAEAAYEKRKARITHARTTSKEQTLKKIENYTGARKYELQKSLIQAEKDREAGRAAVTAAWEDFKNTLAAERENLDALEKKARESFRGSGAFSRLLGRSSGEGDAGTSAGPEELMTQMRAEMQKARVELDRFKQSPGSGFISRLPLWLLAVASLLPLLPFLFKKMGMESVPGPFSIGVAAGITGGLLVVVVGLFFYRSSKAGPAAPVVARALGRARRLQAVGVETSEAHYQQELQRLDDEHRNGTQMIDQQLKQAISENVEMKGTFREKVDEKTVRVSARNEALRKEKIHQLQLAHDEMVVRLKQEVERQKEEIIQSGEVNDAKLKTDFEAAWKNLESEWKAAIQPVYEEIEALNTEADRVFPAWRAEFTEHWTPPVKFEQAAKFGRLNVDLEKLCDALPKDARLALPGPKKFDLPLLLSYPEQGSILFETQSTRREEAVAALNNVVLRLLSATPPGRLNFTILDPVGLGQNFAGVMHMADYEAQIINSKIWTQAGQIEQRLADLNEHMEKVIQMYLRNEYKTIAEYNEQAGNIAEKYHFLVVADFPANFSDVAIKRLLSIAASGARCGVYTLIHWDHRQPTPPDFAPDDLRKSSVCVSVKGNDTVLTGKYIAGATLVLDTPPPAELATEFVHKLGKSSRDSSRVEVPFSHVTPPAEEVWTLDTTSELRVPIGRTGAIKLQYLAIGKGTKQHALIAGKTGSGKSTLFHVIITNLALWCSPEQVEFYLVDFKKGVEFKCYATKRLPHARVVAIESDREFALSVLQRVDDELRRRGDMFRKLGAQDIAGYKRAGGAEAIPRSLLIIDEFQEFFVEDDKVAQTASVLLDRIVRQGRAFGIHVLLGSQTLGGAYTLARTTIGQMVIRIALQCNEADAYLIMDENNPAPRLLSRPGEGIYNDAAGAVEGNNPFQVVWLPDTVRDAGLDEVQARAHQGAKKYAGPVVFEGNAPAEVRENEELRGLLEAEAISKPASPRIWVGAPNAIKGPTEAIFHRQSGNNLVVVGQRDEATTSILAVALISLAAQYPAGAAKFILFDGDPPGAPHRDYLERIVKAIPHNVSLVKNHEVAEVIAGLAGDLKARGEQPEAEAPVTFLLFHGLQKFNKLRHEEDFSFSAGDSETANPGAQLSQIITEGTGHGFHVIATFDTYNNVNRTLSRKAFSEFEMRVLFQMSVNDSASLIDSPKASALGLHRALFYNEQEGYLETFRPYALPDGEWIEQAAKSLARLVK